MANLCLVYKQMQGNECLTDVRIKRRRNKTDWRNAKQCLLVRYEPMLQRIRTSYSSEHTLTSITQTQQ